MPENCCDMDTIRSATNVESSINVVIIFTIYWLIICSITSQYGVKIANHITSETQPTYKVASLLQPTVKNTKNVEEKEQIQTFNKLETTNV